MFKNRKPLTTAIALAAVLSLAAPTAAQAAPPSPSTQVVSMACRYVTKYHSDWFQCWAIFFPAPSNCWYRVYTCS